MKKRIQGQSNGLRVSSLQLPSSKSPGCPSEAGFPAHLKLPLEEGSHIQEVIPRCKGQEEDGLGECYGVSVNSREVTGPHRSLWSLLHTEKADRNALAGL